MRSYGDKITDVTVMSEVLRSLTPKFDHIVVQLRRKDLFVFSFDELMGSLQAHGSRLNRSQDKNEEKAFQVKGEASKKDESAGRGHGRGIFPGRGRGRGRGRGHFN